MSKCGKCGVEITENAKYCKSCGSSVQGSGPSFSEKRARVTGVEKSWIKPALIVAVIIVLVGSAFIFKEFRASRMGGHPMFAPHRDASNRLANAVSVRAQNGDVRIPVQSVEDGNAHFFSYDTGGKTITFFVIKAMDGSISTAFDACVACNHAKLGYRQEGKLIVCNNCGMGFMPGDIGKITGGCNPIPIGKAVDGQMIVLKAKDLDAGVQYF